MALAHYFGDRIGFYVDVGALHPYFGSNTALLYRRGWSGINIEPVPEALSRLASARQRDINLPFAVSDAPGTYEFIVNGSFSGIADPNYLWASDDGILPATISVTTRT